jgi:phosphatidylserine decarboxylase
MTEKAAPYWPYGRNKKFEEIYVCIPADKTGCWGFKSWDDFFTREFCKGARPIAHPDTSRNPDESSKVVITNACESAVYRCQEGVQKRDKFWLKGQPYSLADTLNVDENVEAFVGGTVHQAWLAAECSHS